MMNTANYSARTNSRSPSAKQSGAISLFVVVAILTLLGAVTLSPLRGAIMDQKMSANDYRFSDALHAAEAGLNYGIAYAGEHSISGYAADPNDANYEIATNVFTPLSVAGGSGAYTVNVRYRRRISKPHVVQVLATSTLNADGQVSSTVSQFSLVNQLLTSGGLKAPPVILDGCLSPANGNPDIYPKPASGGNPAGIAIAVSKSSTDTAGSSGNGNGNGKNKKNGNGNGNNGGGGGACIDKGKLDTHGGGEVHNAFPEGGLWDELFAISRGEMQSIASDQAAAGVPLSDRTVIWETGTGNWHASVGSPNQPVILIFAASADCPKINGGPTIYGIVYVDSDCNKANGFGGTEIYGTLAVAGNLKGLTANSEIYDYGYSGGAPKYPVDSSSRFHSTWTDLH